MKKNVMIFLVILGWPLWITAQDSGWMNENLQLFGGGPPVELYSERGWTHITSVDLGMLDTEEQPEEISQRWRLRTHYSISRSGGPSTIQIRFRGLEEGPTFTNPWTEGAESSDDAYSNWYENDFPEQKGFGYLEARLIAPPRTPLSGVLYSVSLEGWNRKIETTGTYSSGTQLAHTGTITANIPARTDQNAALEFSLAFVEAFLTGDLPAYYRAQADTVRSLDDGSAMAKYRIPPPAGIEGVSTLEEYRTQYDFRLYGPSVTEELFPEWYSPARPWRPGPEACLFIGTRNKLSPNHPAEHLVFLVEPDEEGNWKVTARPGS